MAAELTSNDGNSCFTIEFRQPANDDRGGGYIACVQYQGQHSDGDHWFPISALVDGIRLHAATVAALRNHIIQWAHRPLDRLVPADLDSEFELADLPGEIVHIRFGARPNTLSGLNPVVWISFSSWRFQAEIHFTTDQSCLRSFAEGLSEQLIRAETDI